MIELSMQLQAALAGSAPMTQVLMGEWQRKRPDQYRAHKVRVIQSALVDLASPEKAPTLKSNTRACYDTRA